MSRGLQLAATLCFVERSLFTHVVFVEFSQITKVSQDYVNLQQKLNEIILAHQSNPDSNGMFVKGNAVNGLPVKQPSGKKKRPRFPSALRAVPLVL